MEKTLHPVHLGDEVRLRQVLSTSLAMLSNLPLQEKVTIHVKVLQDTIDNQLLSIQIEDTGIGISQEFLQRIFTKIFSKILQPTFVSRYGIRITISNELIQLMGGKRDVVKEKGKALCLLFS